MNATAFKRVIVVAPTRSACVNLKHLLSLRHFPETLLLHEKGLELREAIANLHLGGFGIVAGTGTGKSAAIRELCKRLFGIYDVDLVTMEHKSDFATRKKVVVVTPGVALLWAANGKITERDLVVYDEIHQTSSHLELTMALNKRNGVTAVWMSATINPAIYEQYLEARTVIECDAYDPSRRAKTFDGFELEYHLDEHLPRLARGKCGVAVFVPTRAEAESLATKYSDQFGLYTDFYHGGEPADKLQKFLSGDIPRPFAIFMTAAGASSLNIAGLTTVMIVDSQFTGVIKKGRRTTAKISLDNNTLLQMAGRVNGRAKNGEVHIIGGRHVDLHSLKPIAPAFELGGDLEQLALNIAQQGVSAQQLPLIGGIDMEAYASVENRLISRGAISVTPDGTPQLTSKGRRLQKLPVPVAWGELLLKAVDDNNDSLLRVVASAASLPEIYQVTLRNKWFAHKDARVIYGSDHLTVANILAEAIAENAEVTPSGYKLGWDFGKWCKENKYSQRELRNGALLLYSIYRALGKKLPEPEEFIESLDTGSDLYKSFVQLLLEVASMEYVCGAEHHSTSARVIGNDRNGVSSGRSTIGTFRHWEHNGYNNATIEGTDVPRDMVGRYAQRTVNAIGELTATLGLRAYCHQMFAGERLREQLPTLGAYSSRFNDDYEERLKEQRRGTPMVFDPKDFQKLPLAPVVEITDEAVSSDTWKLLDVLLPAGQQVSWMKLDGYYSQTVIGTPAEMQRMIHEHLNAQAIADLSVADIPSLEESNGEMKLPQICTRLCAANDAMSGRPLVAYGVVEVAMYHGEMKITPKWIASSAEAQRIHRDSTVVLANAGREEAKRRQHDARVTALIERARTLRALTSLPERVASALVTLKHWNIDESWFQRAEAAIKAAEESRAEAQELATECQSVQTEIRRVVANDDPRIDDDTFEALQELAEAKLGEMPVERLNKWRAEANRELAAAQNPQASASEADLGALMAHFGRK